MSGFIDILIYMFLCYISLKILIKLDLLPKILMPKRYDILNHSSDLNYYSINDSYTPIESNINNNNIFKNVKLTNNKNLADISIIKNKSIFNKFKARNHVSAVINL